MKYGPLFAVLGMCLVTSCANQKLYIGEDKVIAPLDSRTEHTLFLVGDAGDTTAGQQANLAMLHKLILEANAPVTVVFLGDNIYPAGMPPEEDTIARKNAEWVLNAQMQVAASTDAMVYFIQGNHDWNRGKEGALKAARRAERFVKNDGDHVRVVPRKGCPGPEVVDLTDDVVLLLIDSQWWLQDWSTEKAINEDCDVESRLDFLAQFGDALKENEDKRIIVALHHPLVSSGQHGGYFTLRDHLFPLTNVARGLWIPLPVIGSIYPIYRSNFGNVQDLAHQKYDAMIRGLRHAAGGYDNVIFVSGHEHALEYNRINGAHYIISGSGAKTSAMARQPSQIFKHGANGFVQLDLLRDGAVNMSVWEPPAPSPVLETNITGGLKKIQAQETRVFEGNRPDSTTALLSEEYNKSGLYRWLFGERYRSLYDLPVTVRNLYLDQELGGLVPVKKGGGFQTNSLRLEADDGRQYVLRSLNKDASRLLPEIFQSTFAMDILQDQFTASHPYAAFVIPGMAAAAGIYYTNPEAVFVPRQAALGKYSSDFADAFYLYEERPDGDWSGYESFGGCDNLMSYSDMLEKRYEDFDDQVDQPFVLRARLFDMFIGDWDRHDDQWRWASFDNPNGSGHYYRPVPRDRDQAFSTYDGLIVKFANWYTPGLRKMGEFEGDIKRIKWFNYNARYFDRDFLTALTRDQWRSVSKDLQSRLTDNVIEQSLAKWPRPVYEMQGEKIVRTLKERRDKIPQFADRYYAVLAREVSVTGTEHADYFIVTRGDGQTRVQAYDSNKEGERNDLYYDRTFFDNETREVRIYGEQGHDNFEITGDGSSDIKVRLIGGSDGDSYITTGKHATSNLHVYDRQKDVQQVPYTRLKDSEDNAFDRLSFKYDYGLPLFVIGGNPDDGFLFGGGIQLVRHGFLKEPYASSHSFKGFYAFGSGSYGFSYNAVVRLPESSTAVGWDAVFEGPSYVQNFFGLGNDSEQDKDLNIDFYRVRKRTYAFIPAILFGNESGGQLGIHLGVRSQKVEATSGRYITDPDNGLPASVFDEKNDGVARVEYNVEITDNPILPRRGMRLNLSAGLDYRFSSETTHRYFDGAFTTYYQLKALGKPTIATRIGAAFHEGSYQFYEGALLGSQGNFRGVRKERFAGDKMFYHNTDIRFRLTQFRNYYLPASMGIVVSFDHGRVWLDDDESDTWHYAYGGGVWVSPFQSLLLSLTYTVSDVDERIGIQMGFFF